MSELTVLGWLQLQPPLAADREKHFRSRIGERDRLADLDQFATTLEDDERRLAVEPRGKAQGTCIAAIEKISSHRLGDDSSPRRDLVQV